MAVAAVAAAAVVLGVVVSPRGVAAQAEFATDVWKQFIVYQCQVLSSRRFQRRFDRATCTVLPGPLRRRALHLHRRHGVIRPLRPCRPPRSRRSPRRP